MSLQPYQQRVAVEKAALDEKLDALKLFMDTDAFRALSPVERTDLNTQLYFMDGYSRVLHARMSRFA